jgi:hypothetical protein
MVDAVDEFPNTPPTCAMVLMRSHTSRVHILVTSRDEHDIRSILERFSA